MEIFGLFLAWISRWEKGTKFRGKEKKPGAIRAFSEKVWLL